MEGTVKAEPIFKETLRLKEIGIKIRYISEITKQNLPYCKILMMTAEFRHMDGIKGNFSVVDGRDYQATAAVNEGDPPNESVLSTARAFVDQQQFIFDMLWHKAIPAKQRIKEIEQGLKREFIETIQDPYETQKVFSNILKSASEEILITLPTKDTVNNKALDHYQQEYLMPLLRDATARGIELRLLVDQSIDENIDMKSLIAGINCDLVEIQVLDNHRHQNKIITAIVDKDLCLTVEVRDTTDYEDENDTSVEVLGLATYSNSESTILSYVLIFDTLWIQAEIRGKQEKASTIA